MSYENISFGWDDEISAESSFVLLPAGTYNFTVSGLKRSVSNGSEKMAACNVAEYTMQLDDGNGNFGTITDRLFLNRKFEWKICQFFLSIGQKKHGVPLHPNWEMAVGSSGKLRLEVRTYVKNDGTQGETNQVKEYLEPAPGTVSESTFHQMPSNTPVPNNWGNGGF